MILIVIIMTDYAGKQGCKHLGSAAALRYYGDQPSVITASLNYLSCAEIELIK